MNPRPDMDPARPGGGSGPTGPMHGQMDAGPASVLALRHGAQRAWVAPAAGGRILRWSTQRAEGPRDWLVPIEATTWPADDWPKGGLFPLVPFSNRIRDARLRWAGHEHALDPQPGQAHALHGQAQRLPWRVLETAADRVTLELEHPAGVGGWPWRWRARQTIRLDASGLQLSMSLRNLDASPMPAGLGWHPYFTAAQTRLAATTQWEHTQELARRPRPNTQRVWQREAGTWTCYLSGWDGRAEIDWPQGPGLHLQTSGPVDHLVLHCNAGRYLCVEPVTQVCDFINLAAAGFEGTGLRVLDPGQTLEAGLALQVRERG